MPTEGFLLPLWHPEPGGETGQWPEAAFIPRSVLTLSLYTQELCDPRQTSGSPFPPRGQEVGGEEETHP